ncbi:MAG: hypothetical protein K2N05_05870 [Muribaculaceae bacterium]|nr:hypothetical protein [Muribaculaceae bacterium]
MIQSTKVLPLEKAQKKYEQFRDMNNGMAEVTVFLDKDGSEDSSSWNSSYKNQLQSVLTSKKGGKSRKKGSKRYFGMSPWNPLRWLLWVFYLFFRIIWKILKVFGLGFIGDWIGGDAGDIVSDGADYLESVSDITEVFDFDLLDAEFFDGGDLDIEVFEDMEELLDENPKLVDKKNLKSIKKLLDKKKKKAKKKSR